MSLKVVKDQRFESTATVNLKAFQASFGIVCRLIGKQELEALQLRWSGKAAVYADPIKDKFAGTPPITPAVVPTITDREFIDAWLVAFAPDVTGPDDQPLPFTAESVSNVLDMPGVNMAVIAAFFRGYEEAETKNSSKPPAGS